MGGSPKPESSTTKAAEHEGCNNARGVALARGGYALCADGKLAGNSAMDLMDKECRHLGSILSNGSH